MIRSRSRTMRSGCIIAVRVVNPRISANNIDRFVTTPRLISFLTATSRSKRLRIFSCIRPVKHLVSQKFFCMTSAFSRPRPKLATNLLKRAVVGQCDFFMVSLIAPQRLFCLCEIRILKKLTGRSGYRLIMLSRHDNQNQEIKQTSEKHIPVSFQAASSVWINFCDLNQLPD